MPWFYVLYLILFLGIQCNVNLRYNYDFRDALSKIFTSYFSPIPFAYLALHLAVANNNSIIVDILSSVEGADLTLQDNMMRTALHWAAVLGFESLTKLLLPRGANYAIPDAIGATALHYAAQCDQPECLIEMMQFSEIVDVPDHEGRSVVMWAAGKGLSASIEILAKHKFDLKAFDKTGATALHVASFAGFLECTEMLLKYGAGVDAQFLQGLRPHVGHDDIG